MSAAVLHGRRAPGSGETGAARRLAVLAPYVHRSSFIEWDLTTIGSRHGLRLVACRPAWRIAAAIGACYRSDLVFCWFGSLRFLPVALAARAFGKPVVIVAGGYDVANVPEIAYGNMRPGLVRILGRWLFRTASMVVCYSQSGAREAAEQARVPASRLRLIHLGFDGDRIGAGDQPLSKERLVLTVAGIDGSTLQRKGLLAVCHVSRLLPDVPFVIAGAAEPAALDRLRTLAGANVAFTGRVSEATLYDLYRRATVYFQPSLHEAFGCSVAEAMLFDCTPVVTRCYSLPEVVGDCGYYVEPEDFDGMAAAVRTALDRPPPGAEAPRSRILREFPASRRRVELLALLEELHG
jgi:glycosyltransferase involved in cell wall biosynthesis